MVERKITIPFLPKPDMEQSPNLKWIVGAALFLFALGMVFFFNSSLARIDTIQLKGTDLLTQDRVLALAGVNKGSSYFVPTEQTIIQRLMTDPMIQKVDVNKSFPGKMYIYVHEYAKIAYQMDKSGAAKVRLSNGTAISVAPDKLFVDRPLLTGWKDTDPNLSNLIGVMGEIPVSQLAEVSEIRPFPSFAYPDKIKIYTRDGYEVHTTITYLKKKIGFLRQIIVQVEANKYKRGYIELLEADVFRPFSEDVQKNLLNPTN